MRACLMYNAKHQRSGYGYFGYGRCGLYRSHTVLTLLERGEEVVVLDNLCNASEESLHRVEQLTGKAAVFYRGDILDRNASGVFLRSSRLTPLSILRD